jgi:hypothetical protein
MCVYDAVCGSDWISFGTSTGSGSAYIACEQCNAAAVVVLLYRNSHLHAGAVVAMKCNR